jgi:hypothetical protein
MRVGEDCHGCRVGSGAAIDRVQKWHVKVDESWVSYAKCDDDVDTVVVARAQEQRLAITAGVDTGNAKMTGERTRDKKQNRAGNHITIPGPRPSGPP